MARRHAGGAAVARDDAASHPRQRAGSCGIDFATQNTEKKKGRGAPEETSVFSHENGRSGKHLTPSSSGLSRGSTPLLGAAIASEKGVDARDERERDEPFSLDGGAPAGRR